MPDFQIFWSANRPLVFDATLERLDFVRYADFREDPILNPLGTPSGRIEIYSEVIEKMNYKDCKAFPQWFEPAEWKGMKDKPAEFALLSPHPSLRLHSQLANTRLRDEYAVVNREPIWINPADAKAKDIQNGDLVRTFNKRGQILAGAVVSDIVDEGVVRIYEGAWYDPSDASEANILCKNGSANVLTMDIPTSELANGNSACTALVNIAKYTGTPPEKYCILATKRCVNF
ncbi:molybdopterin dinucleotide binding domain-containing protein [Helicobacter equorum]|uniref:molybdopterin dinucleotide binding domain-containing protein n=1 Tax=Helicobacter equorum TaxID=361872 RepID=UPI001FD52EED|nr:molybdopterin dinucleotide binding domain-containing protein [Helicobacter equorum]